MIARLRQRIHRVSALLEGATFSGSGHPSDALGSDGDTYNRTDKTGWVYEKGLATAGVWTLRERILGSPDPFPVAGFYCNYLPDSASGNKWGNLLTNGRSNSVTYAMSQLDAHPEYRQGYDGADNWAKVTDPVKGAPFKATKSRVNWLDAPTAGGGATYIKRASSRFGTSGTHDGARPLMPLRSPQVFAFSMMLPGALKTDFTGNDNEIVMFQVHDNGQGSGLSPTITALLLGSTSTSNGTSAGSVRILWQNRYDPNFPGSDATDTGVNLIEQTDITPDVWHHYVIEFKLSYQASDSPYTKIHHAVDGGAFSLIVNDTNPNSYNADAGGDDHYLQHGIYSYRDTDRTTLDTDGSWTMYFKDVAISSPNTTLTADDLEDVKRYLQIS